MTVTATGGTGSVYGVYNAADTPTAIAKNGNINISGKLTVNLINGSSNDGIHTGSGGTITLDDATVNTPSNHYYGIYNRNGNVVIQNNSNVTLASTITDSEGICASFGGDLIIKNSTVKVSAHGYAVNLEYGKLLIENSDVELSKTSGIGALVVYTPNDVTNTIDLSGSGSGPVTLTASGDKSGSMIGGGVTLGPSTKCEKGTHYDYGSYENYDGKYDAAIGKTVLKFVHEATAPTANISLSETGTVDFGSMEAGYSAAPTAKTVTITNNGTAATGALTIALEGTHASSFELNKTSISDITDGTSDTFTVQPKTALTAGTYTATVKVSGTGAGVTEQRFDVKFTVTAPATPITEALVPVTDLTGKTYDESAQEPTFGGSLARDTDYTVSYAVKSGFTGTLNSDGKPVGAGTYVVTVAGKGSYTGSFTKDFKIDKADPSYTAPTAKTGLAYTGSALELITAGSVSKGGEMQYKQGSGSYGPDIPVATNAGDYIVYYQITANDNYNAVAETQVGGTAINIAQVEWGAPTETLTPVNPTTAGGSEGKITGTTSAMQYKKSTDSSWKDCTGNLDYKWYQNGTTQVAANNTGKYTLRADDIGKTITVKITSDVQTGEITSAATATVGKADGPTAPSAFTLTFTPNSDGTTYTATIPTVAGGEYSFDGTNYSATNTKANCAANTSYTGHVRIAATSTQKASAATSSTQTSPKLTVATPTFTPNGASSFTGTQSVTISCTTVGATIHYTTDGTAPTASSPVYSTALSLTSTTTVKAIAVKAGMNDSATATATFTKKTGGGSYYAPTAAVVPDMPMLYRGCTGDAVKTLQDKLNTLGYNSGNVDGIFGAKTYAAVTAFQKANSLGVDGIVGKLTWGKLYGVSPAMPVETTTVVGRPMVSYGSRGDAVRKLQELLNALGYDCGSVDGIFGSKTKAAVLAFQKANGLGMDGIVGPLTWAKLG
jgi:methionine-rich copper-binding protein CopC